MTGATFGRAPRREIFAWAMFDFANSGYTTVVLTTIYNAYFVSVVAKSAAGGDHGAATLLWTVALGVSNLIVLASAPVIGALADARALKKSFLAVTTVGCVAFTALLGLAEPGEVLGAMILVIAASVMFASGENLISAFLPEIAPQRDMGRISGYGWSLGYLGGLLVLVMCFAYIVYAESLGYTPSRYVPVTLWITAAMFAAAALPTFLWLRERARPQLGRAGESLWRVGFARVGHTLKRARHYRDLFRFLLTLAFYFCGIQTVVVLAAVYAQQVMGFDNRQTVMLILVVNLTAALGALAFGYVQDRIGSVPTLAITLSLWLIALIGAYFVTTAAAFWVIANLVGLALGSSQSAGRALIGQFSPPARAAEFFGLWGLAGKLAAIVGPMSYGLITYASRGDHRLALLSTAAFFLVGLALLATVDERRGRAAALTEA